MLPMRDGRTNEQTREDRATQPIDPGWLSFAIVTTLPLKIIFCVNFMLSDGVQSYTNLQHNLLHMGSTPPPPLLTQYVKKHPTW